MFECKSVLLKVALPNPFRFDTQSQKKLFLQQTTYFQQIYVQHENNTSYMLHNLNPVLIFLFEEKSQQKEV